MSSGWKRSRRRRSRWFCAAGQQVAQSAAVQLHWPSPAAPCRCFAIPFARSSPTLSSRALLSQACRQTCSSLYCLCKPPPLPLPGQQMDARVRRHFAGRNSIRFFRRTCCQERAINQLQLVVVAFYLHACAISVFFSLLPKLICNLLRLASWLARSLACLLSGRGASESLGAGGLEILLPRRRLANAMERRKRRANRWRARLTERLSRINLSCLPLVIANKFENYTIANCGKPFALKQRRAESEREKAKGDWEREAIKRAPSSPSSDFLSLVCATTLRLLHRPANWL